MTSSISILDIQNSWPNSPREENVKIHISDRILDPAELIDILAKSRGCLEVVTWYEGTQGVFDTGARFLNERIFQPLLDRRELTFLLYSLKGWGFEKTVSKLSTKTAIGEAVESLKNRAFKSLYSADYFRFCLKSSDEWKMLLQTTLLEKKELMVLSASQREKGKSVADFFEGQSSLFDAIRETDLSRAYAQMQYGEFLYLCSDRVKEALAKGLDVYTLAFVLPNSEARYYVEIEKDVRTALKIECGEALEQLDLTIRIDTFFYGQTLESRPYIDKQPKAVKVQPKAISAYLAVPKAIPKTCSLYLRDMIHNLI